MSFGRPPYPEPHLISFYITDISGMLVHLGLKLTTYDALTAKQPQPREPTWILHSNQ